MRPAGPSRHLAIVNQAIPTAEGVGSRVRTALGPPSLLLRADTSVAFSSGVCDEGEKFRLPHLQREQGGGAGRSRGAFFPGSLDAGAAG